MTIQTSRMTIQTFRRSGGLDVPPARPAYVFFLRRANDICGATARTIVPLLQIGRALYRPLRRQVSMSTDTVIVALIQVR